MRRAADKIMAGLRDALRHAIETTRHEKPKRKQRMPTKPTKVKLTQSSTGKTKVEPVKPRASVSKRIGAEKKAKRAVKAIEKAAPGRVRVAKRSAIK